MIPADDAHCTVELEDRYVILQSFANAARDAYLHRGGKPVAEGFSYSSDTNPGKAGRARPADPAGRWPMPDRADPATRWQPAFLPYGRQEIGDADVKAVVEALVLRLADHRPPRFRIRTGLCRPLRRGRRRGGQFRHRRAALRHAGASACKPGDEVIVPAITFAASRQCRAV